MRAVAEYRTFDGDKYELYGGRATKKIALREATNLRRQGIHARVVPICAEGAKWNYGTRWLIYTRWTMPVRRK